MQIGIYTILVACLAGTGFAAPLEARQLGGVTDAVGDAAGMAMDAAEGALGSAGDAAGMATDMAGGALDGVTGGLGDTVLGGTGGAASGLTDSLGGLTKGVGGSGSSGDIVGSLLGGLLGQKMAEMEQMKNEKRQLGLSALQGLSQGDLQKLLELLGGKMPQMEEMKNEKRQLGAVSGLTGGLTGSGGGSPTDALSGIPVLGSLLSGLLGQKMVEEQMQNEKRQLDAVSGLAGSLGGAAGAGDLEGLLGGGDKKDGLLGLGILGLLR